MTPPTDKGALDAVASASPVANVAFASVEAAASSASSAADFPHSPSREGALDNGKAQALRIAADLLAEHGVPRTYDQAVKLVACSYARGALDGHIAAAETILSVDLREAMEAVVSA